MNSVSCRIAAPWVTAIGSGDDVSFAPVRRHIDTCLFCQASIARKRRLHRSMEGPVTVPETTSVVAFSSVTVERSSARRPGMLGAVGAVVAVGIGVIGIRRALSH